MGWTYCAYAVKKNSIDFEKYKNDWALDPLLEDVGTNGDCVLDDSTFDRECLGFWMGITEEQRNEIDTNGCCKVTVDQFKNAQNFLKDLVAQVKKMPFDYRGKNEMVYDGFDKKSGESKYKWTGTRNNKAIYDLVMKSFAKDYHFTFPWQKGKLGVPDYIETLGETITKIEQFYNNSDEYDILLFSY